MLLLLSYKSRFRTSHDLQPNGLYNSQQIVNLSRLPNKQSTVVFNWFLEFILENKSKLNIIKLLKYQKIMQIEAFEKIV